MDGPHWEALTDMMTFLIMAGVPLAWAVRLPLPSFYALYESVSRVHYRQKVENLWAAATAAQGTQKSIQEFAKPWQKAAAPASAQSSDATSQGTGKDFLRHFGAALRVGRG